MADFEITNVGALEALGKRIRQVGRKDLKKELAAGARKAAKPMIPKVRAAARRTLPSRGGLANRVATSKIGVRTKQTGKDASVRLVGTSGLDLNSIDDGILRHPVFKTGQWVEQPVKPGFWSDTLDAEKDNVQRELLKAMEIVARKLTADG